MCVRVLSSAEREAEDADSLAAVEESECSEWVRLVFCTRVLGLGVSICGPASSAKLNSAITSRLSVQPTNRVS